MDKKRTIRGFLLLMVAVVNSFVMAVLPCKISSAIELFNNTEDTIFVDKEQIKSNRSLYIPFDKNCTNVPLFTIKYNSAKGYVKRYRVYYKQPDSKNPYNESSIVKLDFITIRFVATSTKKNTGYDEICLHNDTPYDIFISYLNKGKNDVDKQYHKRHGITIEPGRTFHKTVCCAKSKATKNLHALGLLLLSIMTAESKDIHSVPYHCRAYTHSSLIGNEGWKTVTLSANTIKWFKSGFSTECS